MRLKGYLFGVIFLLLKLNLKADDRFGTIGQYSIEGSYQFGKILQHDSKFTTPVNGFTHAFELGFYKQTLGEKAWQRKLNYPEFGGFFYLAYNEDKKIFGNAYLWMMMAKFWIVRSKTIDFYARIGTGLAYVPVHYNIITNPENVAIGSSFNAGVQARLGVDIKIDPHVVMTWGMGFTHYSNSSTQLPNLGINVPSLVVGIRYFPKVSADMKYNRDKIPRPDKRNEVMMKFSMAINETHVYGGPKYPTYIGTVNYARYTSVANKVLLGASAEFSQGDYDRSLLMETNPKYGARANATKIGIFVGDEILMGRVGLFFILEHYLFVPPTGFSPIVKIGLNYYFVSVGKKKGTKFFVGANLKAYYFTAQNYEISTGVAF